MAIVVSLYHYPNTEGNLIYSRFAIFAMMTQCFLVWRSEQELRVFRDLVLAKVEVDQAIGDGRSKIGGVMEEVEK